jgi:hypothetical protein
MLDIKKAHLDFGQQLQPPPGFEIDYVVATSYSLDLYALLSIPLAIYYNQSLDSEVSEDNFQILEAIQNLQKNLKIYCHKGKITVPKTTSLGLLAFVEKCVVEITPETAYKSFHPKVWVLRFKSTDDTAIRYRLIVMSRNLTFDKSYDIAYWMEGDTKTANHNTNSDLINFLKDLNEKSAINHKSFIKDLSRVNFGLCEHFDTYNTTSLPHKDWEERMGLKQTYRRRMIISPFLSKDKLVTFNNCCEEELIVFSRKNELDKIPATIIDKIEPYCFEQEIVDHHLYSNAEEGDKDEYELNEWDNNLHAKLYLREDKDITYWDLGSANCSDAAFERNVEFMLHLSTVNQETSIERIKEELITEYNGVSVFKEYKREDVDPEPIEEPDNRQLEFQMIASIGNQDCFKAWIEKNDKYYDLLLKWQLPKIIKEKNLKLIAIPFGSTQRQEVRNEKPVRFENMPLHKLSSFIHFQIFQGKDLLFDFVTKVDIKNMPEYRLNSILKSIIDNPEKFMALLMSLLTNEPVLANSALDKEDEIGGMGSQNYSSLLSIPVYEDLLINLSRSPQRLIRLSCIVEKLVDLGDEEIIPDDFKQLWDTIKQILPNEK